VVLLALVRPDAPPVAGAILVAPAVWGGASLPALYRDAIKATARLLPGFRLSGRGLPVRPAEDPEVVRALAADPLYIGDPNLASVAGLVELMDRAVEAAPGLRARTLLLVPGRDDIVPSRVQLLFAPTIGAAECRVLLYPEARHLLLRDRGRERVFADLLAWLEGREPGFGFGRPCREPAAETAAAPGAAARR